MRRAAAQTDTVQALYRASAGHVRGSFARDGHEAAHYFRRYVAFVLGHVPRRPARILDVGCGNGWSSWILRQAGHDVCGSDLHAGPLEGGADGTRLPYVAADARRLPFACSAFDVVAMHAVLEHVPDPASALRECLRVLRPCGRLIVVGPHLLSVGLALRFALKESWRSLRRPHRLTRRRPDTPRHPFGNTLAETYRHLGHHTWHTLHKLVGERCVRFLMREPDPRPPFHGDNDACYFCNPMDLITWTRQTPGTRLLCWWANDRPRARLLWPVAGGTWVVIEKTASVTACGGKSA